MRFKEKTVIVTGAASGLGFDAAQAFAQEGANVVLTDVDQEAVKKAAARLPGKGKNALAVPVDVRNYRQVKKCVATALKKFGRIDILLNAAGGSAGRVLRCPLGEEFHKQWYAGRR